MRPDKDTYRLPWGARVTRWWRSNREALSLGVVVVLTVGAIAAFVSGNPIIGAGLAVVALLYLIYAYTNWFNDMH